MSGYLDPVPSADEVADRRARRLASARQEEREELIRTTTAAPLLERIQLLEQEIADLAPDQARPGHEQYDSPIITSLVRYRRMYREHRTRTNQLERALAAATGSPIPPLETATVRRIAAVFAAAVRRAGTRSGDMVTLPSEKLDELIVTLPVRNI